MFPCICCLGKDVNVSTLWDVSALCAYIWMGCILQILCTLTNTGKVNSEKVQFLSQSLIQSLLSCCKFFLDANRQINFREFVALSLEVVELITQERNALAIYQDCCCPTPICMLKFKWSSFKNIFNVDFFQKIENPSDS